MGSVLGTIADAVDALQVAGHRVGALGVTTLRPFPAAAVRAAPGAVPSAVVVDRAFSPGFGGVLATDVAMAPAGADVPVASVVVGLGGRPVTEASLRRLAERALDGSLEAVTFLDLDESVVEAALAADGSARPTGPTAESVLRHRGARSRRPGTPAGPASTKLAS